MFTIFREVKFFYQFLSISSTKYLIETHKNRKKMWQKKSNLFTFFFLSFKFCEPMKQLCERSKNVKGVKES